MDYSSWERVQATGYTWRLAQSYLCVLCGAGAVVKFAPQGPGLGSNVFLSQLHHHKGFTCHSSLSLQRVGLVRQWNSVRRVLATGELGRGTKCFVCKHAHHQTWWPQSHMMEGETWLLQVVLWPSYELRHINIYTNKCNFLKFKCKLHSTNTLWVYNTHRNMETPRLSVHNKQHP